MANKYKDKSFADIAKMILKEVEAKPNDPIAKRTADEMMSRLAQAQEEYNYKREQRKLAKAFDRLSTEDKMGLMQMIQQPVQSGVYAQPIQEMSQIPQEENMQPMDYDLAQYASGGSIHIKPSKRGTFTAAATKHGKSVQAFASQVLAHPENYSPAMVKKANFARNASKWHSDGGNLYQNGGDIKKAVMQALNIHTQSDLDKVLDWYNLKESDIDWNDIRNNPALLKVIANDSPALADAIARGYDFGAYNASGLPTATLDFNQKGNWDRTSGRDWLGSSDLAYTQAVEGLTNDEIRALTREQLAQRMRNTEAYKNTTKWLQDENNALAYLNTLMNYEGTPQGARNWASRFIEKGADGRWNWKPNVNYDYNTIIGKYREDNAPGSYWYTAREANRGNKNINYVINDDGSIEEILTTPDASWIKDNTYNWADTDNNYTATYYRRPATTIDEGKAAASPDTIPTEPIRDNLLRKIPVIGSGLQALAAFNTPTDFTYSNALNRLAGMYNPIAPTLLGRERENDLDVNLANNEAMAQQAAMQRANRETSNRWTQNANNLALFNAYSKDNAARNLNWQQAQQADDLAVHKLNYDLGIKDQDTIRAYDLANLENNARRIAMKQASAKAADDATTLASTNRSQSLTNFLNNLGALGKESMQFALVNKAIRDNALKGLGNEDLYTPIFNWLNNTTKV